MKMSEVVKRNSEILFLYDATLCNPNGDPDDENRPRYDYDTQRSLVSDVRLKRYIRDYWINKGLEVFVAKSEGGNVDATTRVENNLEKAGKKMDKLSREEIAKFVKESFVDIRHFGATVPIKSRGGGKGESVSITGAIQFAWGYSLHPAEILSSATITSILSGRDSAQGSGTMGKDWRIKYALIGFYGLVSAWRARESLLTEDDIANFDETVIKALITMASTRSKIDQKPRFYLRIEWKDDETFVGDLRDYITVNVKTPYNPAKLEDIEVDFSDLNSLLEEKKEKIEKVKLFTEREFGSLFGNLEIPQGVTIEKIEI
jgi:CRISPR-associated protein Csh2